MVDDSPGEARDGWGVHSGVLGLREHFGVVVFAGKKVLGRLELPDGDPNLRLAPEDSRSASAASCSMNLLDSGMR